MYFLAGAAIVALFIALFKLFLGRRRTRNPTDSITDTPQQSDSTSTSEDSDSVPLPVGEYEVFLSFRGPDTRNNVTDILYRFLVRSKIRTFRDDDELRKGEGIWPNLVKAIGQSKISVLIFSPRYAESKWCLKELAEIVEHRKREKGHVILPIFYKVDPRDIRHHTGPYESAFQQYKRNNFDEETIQSWKVALNEVGSLKGWHIKVEEEVADVADVVSGVVWSHLIKNNNTLETDELVGIDNSVEQVVDMLDLGAEGVNLVGIHGMGGIGKTTLATAVYNKVSTCFDRYSFVKDIRETQKQTDGVLILQKKLLSNILKMESVGSEAKQIIRERVTQFKILVVLDDVDERFNFEEVLGKVESFAPGSRFIITSRDIKLLTVLRESQSKLYEVQGMNPRSSLQLFCKHAFKKDFPLPGFEVLSENVVSTTGGLPLTLKVIGSFLFREEEFVWKGKLEQLQEMPEKGVLDRLMISYDALNYEAQQIFLDIACFHIGTDKEIASYMWTDCKFHPVVNVNVLVQKSMIKIGKENGFQMHDQLRDMGREIVRRESIEYPWMRSRIWSDKEAMELLVNNKGTKQVKAIRLDLSSYIELNSVQSECFTNLSELRYVDAGFMSLIGDFNHFLPNLKWIKSFSNLMGRINMKQIIVVDVYNLGDDCIQIKEAKKLKFLTLRDCKKMSKLPEFPESLEMLHLICFSNKEEDMELGNLQNLKVLILRSCTLGRIKGGTFGMMKGLRELNLTEIKCDFHNFRRVIADIGELLSLESLDFNSPALKDVLKGIKLPKSLKVLNTSSSFDNLWELLDLEEFSVENKRRTIEIVMSPAAKLKSMMLHSKTMISIVEGQTTMLPSSLTIVHISDLKSARIPNLKNLGNLTKLRLFNSPYLEEIQGLGGLKSLETLQMGDMKKLVDIEGLGNLMSSSNCKLTEVVIAGCPLLRAFQTFEQHDDDDTNDAIRIESLLSLKIIACPLMDCRSIPKVSKFPRLRELSICEIGWKIDDEAACHQELLEGLDNLVELVELQVSRLPNVERLPSLSKLTKLTKLMVSRLPCLREIVGLGELKSLKELEVSGCLSLERLSNLEGLPYSNTYHIELDLRGCINFSNVDTDLSPLTTAGAALSTVLFIKWPHEPYEESDDDDDMSEEFDDDMSEESDDDL